MRNLEHYVTDYNRWRRIWGDPPVDISNPTDLQRVAARVEGDLSPENLTCDGELPADVVAEQHRYLLAVAKEIKQLNPSIQFWEIDHV